MNILKNNAVSLTAGFVIVAAGNILFHIAAARLLGPAAYGSLGALLTILLLSSVPADAIQVALTAQTTHIFDQEKAISWSRLFFKFAGAGTACTLTFVISSPSIVEALNIDASNAAVILGLFFVPAFANIVTRAVLLGRRRYLALTYILMGSASLKLVGGTVLIALWPQVSTALWVVVLSEAALGITLLYVCGRTTNRAVSSTQDLTIAPSELVTSSLAFAGFWAIVSLDTILAKRQLDAEAAGIYAASALIARSVLFIPQSIVSSSLPELAQKGARGRNALLNVVRSSAATAAVCAAGVSLLGSRVIPLLLGDRYSVESSVLATLACAAIFASLLNVAINYQIAQGATIKANTAWFGVAILVTAGSVVTQSIHLAGVTFAALSLALLAATIGIFTKPDETAPAQKQPAPTSESLEPNSKITKKRSVKKLSKARG